MAKVNHDLICKQCGNEVADIKAERKPDGVYIDTPEAKDVAAICEHCGNRLDIALRSFAIGRSRSNRGTDRSRYPEYMADYVPQTKVGDPAEVLDRGDGKPGMGIVEQVGILGHRPSQKVVAEIVTIKPIPGSSSSVN